MSESFPTLVLENDNFRTWREKTNVLLNATVSIDGRLVSNEALASSNETRIGSAENDISTIQSDITDLQNQDVTHTNDIQTNANDISAIDGRVTVLESLPKLESKGNWQPSTSYTVGDVVVQGTFKNVYVANTNHTSTTIFTDDLSNWDLLVDLSKSAEIWSTRTADFNAATGLSYFVDSSSGNVTVTLPASPSIGDYVQFTHLDGDVSVLGEKFIIDRNGEMIMGVADDLEVDKNFLSFKMVYAGATYGWRVTIL